MLTLSNRAKAVSFAYLLTASALIANEAVILPEVSESDSSNSPIVVANDDYNEGELYILPQFTVSGERDRGYYSGDTLAGTRTNQMIKDTPMTISVVNKDLMEDLNLTEISSLENVVASIQDEGESYSNSVIRFRGLLTRNQLFEFMQRVLGQDSYNVDRTEVIRGANSLVYGQAAPGGKANYLAKKAEFGDDETEIRTEIGENNKYRASIDHNQQINDALAIRFMSVYDERDYDQNFKSKTLDGQTLAVAIRPSDKTQINLHFERFWETRLNPRSAYLDRTGDYGLTGILEDLPATPDIVDFLSADALQYMIDYNDGSLSRGGYTTSTPEYPQLDINSAEDLRRFYENAGINENNFGYGSPELTRDRYGYFILGDITHQWTDDLVMKTAIAQQERKGKTQQLASTGDIFLSATSRGGLRDEGDEPNLGFYPGDGTDPSAMPSPYIIPTWEKSRLTDETDSIRTTLSWSKDVKGSKQQFLLGLDYDRRESTDIQYQQVLSGTQIATDGSWNSSLYRAKDYILLSDYHINGYDDFQTFNFTNELSPNFNPDALFGSSRTPGVEEGGANFYALRRKREAKINTKALWLANQGSFMNGRFNTLLGLRFDLIHMKALSQEVQAGSAAVPVDETYNDASPSVGALYWVNKNIALFGSYAHSIESPTGWDINPIGESVPAETGIGFEGGLKFEFMDSKLSGQVSLFDITKENDMLTSLGTAQLMRLYPFADYPLLYESDGTGFSPSGRKVAGIDTQSRGVEIDLYYNPSEKLSLFLGYAYSDALFQSGPNDPISGQALLEEGQRVPGTAKHSANFTARYNFREGKLKGTYLGANLNYRSKSYYNRLYADVGSDSRQKSDGSERDYEGGIGPGFYDGRPDIFPNVDSDGKVYEGAYTQFYDIWLDDTFITNVFIGWSGRLFDTSSQAPRYSFQLSADNLFDCRELYASGNNPRYTDGRRIRLKASIKF
jgi:outer membrane receptor protein involved in Fe transport